MNVIAIKLQIATILDPTFVIVDTFKLILVPVFVKEIR
jgi:hypothetical protein